MRNLLILVIVLATIVERRAAGGDPAYNGGKPESNAVCVIHMQTDPPSGGYEFQCVDGVPYFEVSRARKPEDKIVPFASAHPQYCRFFELSTTEGIANIKNLGVGHIANESGKFISDEMTEAKPPPKGRLVVDDSTNPPSVKIASGIELPSFWEIRDSGTKGLKWSIEFVGKNGRRSSLSMAKDASAVLSVGYENKEVVEFRRAVLSDDTKPLFSIDVSHPDAEGH
jgi:hypothetical protein